MLYIQDWRVQGDSDMNRHSQEHSDQMAIRLDSESDISEAKNK